MRARAAGVSDLRSCGVGNSTTPLPPGPGCRVASSCARVVGSSGSAAKKPASDSAVSVGNDQPAARDAVGTRVLQGNQKGRQTGRQRENGHDRGGDAM